MAKSSITKILGKDAKYLLDHQSKTISKDKISLPGPDFVDRVFVQSNRSPQVLRSLNTIFNHGRLGGTGCINFAY